MPKDLGDVLHFFLPDEGDAKEAIPKPERPVPDLLKKQGAGAQVRRTDTALIQAYGKSLDQLAPMWRAASPMKSRIR